MLEAKLKQVMLTKVNLELDETKITKDRTKRSDAVIPVTINLSIGLLKPKKTQQNAKVELFVVIDSESSPFTLEIKYCGLFIFNQKLDASDPLIKKEVSNLCGRALFPFLREAVIDITRRMAVVEPVVLGFEVLELFKESPMEFKTI